jgi:hypothetical protein
MSLVTEQEIADRIHREVLGLLGPLKSVPSGWQKQNCKLCHHRGHGHDKRERFGVIRHNDGSVVVNCFNCGFSSSWTPGKTLSKSFKWFLETIGMSKYDVKRLDFELYKLRNNMKTGSTLKMSRDVTKEWKEVELPKGSKTIREWAEEGCTDENFLGVVQYLVDRDLLYPDTFYWTPKDLMYKNRATYPFIYDGKIVGYTGRYVKEIKDKKMPKYHAETPESFLTNLDRQKREDKKFVILTEGVFDAHVVDGVAVLGNNLTADQISIIERLGKEIIVVPDKDKDGQLLFDTAIEHGWTISTPDWGAGVKDPAGAVEKYGRILTVQSIIESRDKNAFAAKLKRKLDKF